MTQVSLKTRLGSCGDDRLGRLWRVEDGSPGPVLRGHEASVWEAVFNEDGSRLVTRGKDAATCVWEIPSGRLLLTHVEYADQGWLSFEPGGHYVAGGKAAEWARIRVDGELYPLSSYASVLESPEDVRASLAGEEVRAHSLLPAPELELFTLPNGEVFEPLVRVEGRIKSDHGIAEVTVTRGGRRPDGSEVAPRPLAPEDVAAGLREVRGNRDLRLALEVPIPEGWSEVLVRVRARSGRDIWSQVETVHRRYVPPVGKLRVLAIGVQDYDDDRYDLSSAAKDARDVAALFAAQTELFGEVETRVLLDSEVSQASLNEALEEFLYPAGEDDTIVVFVAGHGARSKRTGSYYFLTSEATPEKPTSGIPRDQIYKLVRWGEIRARKRLLLIDTCHAGEDYTPGERGLGVGLDESFDQREVNDALSEGNGLYIVSASRELGVAREQEGNGVFTGVLLEGLRGAADTVRNRGTVDVEELMRFVQDTVPDRTGGAQRPTVPQGLGGVPFPLARVQEASAEGGR